MAKCKKPPKKNAGKKSKKKVTAKKSVTKAKAAQKTTPAKRTTTNGTCACPTGAVGVVGSRGRKKPQKQMGQFQYFIRKVLEQTDADLSISQKAMTVMNSFVNDIFEQVAEQAAKLIKFGTRKGKKTITANDIEAAVKLLLPGDLHQHAAAEGSQALAKFKSAK